MKRFLISSDERDMRIPPSLQRAVLLVTETRGGRRAALSALVIRLASGAIFIVFGVGKFANHHSEAASFATYGLPHPGMFAFAIGAVEVIFGILLVAGLGTRIAAFVLAGDMVGAISTAGRVEGGALNLGLAPTLLLAMIVLVGIGSGPRSFDQRFARRLRG